jgi:hypothetical protein|uniref:Uncharacterized protein n=1 Tax=Siphoviridae sp. ct0D87 TaxID=2827760 RepID=A0A8S5SAI4_9CAUD|nr:MAG TPA: hypothetical protein [Siphoviridae sp. ct0D87]
MKKLEIVKMILNAITIVLLIAILIVWLVK